VRWLPHDRERGHSEKPENRRSIWAC